MRNFMMCSANRIFFWLSNQGGCDEWYRWHVWGKSDTHLRVLVAKHEGKRPLLKT